MTKENANNRYPLIILRDIVIMPESHVHFDIKNKNSVSTIEKVIEQNQELVVVKSKTNEVNEDISESEFFKVGTKVVIRQILKLPGGVVRIMAEGKERVIIKKIYSDDDCNLTEIKKFPNTLSNMEKTEQEARLRIIKDLAKQCRIHNMFSSPDRCSSLLRVKKLDKLIDLMADSVSIPVLEKQKLLETIDMETRSDLLIKTLITELDIHNIRAEIGEKLKDCVNQNQKEYVLREQIKIIKKELGEENAEDEGARYRQLLAEGNPPEYVREKLEKEISRFCSLPYSSSESAVIRNYIETVLDYPWNKESCDNQDLKKAIAQLEKDHYGLTNIKERIIDYLAARQLSGRKDAPILCLVGPPGTGKTSIAKSIAVALYKEYGRIALGGVRDEAEIRGHRKTYIGAMPGRILTAISKTGVNNPLILLDEIDKTGTDYKGDVSSALLEVLDGEQNMYFQDHYFEVPVDLSNVLFLATANDVSQIPAPLRDRMEVIEVNSYTENEKFHIAKSYLLRKQLAKNGLKNSQFKITDDAIYYLIEHYTKEAGVRNLERLLGTLMQKAARGILTEQYKSLRVTPKKLKELLGAEKYFPNANALADKVGVVNGLAWTRVGGDTLGVEVNLLNGKGGLTLTGNLGDVMKESAQIALSYVRTLPDIKKLPDDYFEKHIVHIHVPEGATPKDGPSAGITIALAIYSALTNRLVDGHIAMTGEITLKGKVLPIGGLKEKLLAAKNAGMQKVLVPAENRRNVEELDDEITSGLDICYVDHMSEVIKQGIVKKAFALKQ